MPMRKSLVRSFLFLTLGVSIFLGSLILATMSLNALNVSPWDSWGPIISAAAMIPTLILADYYWQTKLWKRRLVYVLLPLVFCSILQLAAENAGYRLDDSPRLRLAVVFLSLWLAFLVAPAVLKAARLAAR